MTATLFTQLKQGAAVGLVADIVLGVLDERHRSVQDRSAESAVITARQHLKRLIRAGSLNPSNDRPGMGPDRAARPRSAG
jgi:hypothetical protein